MALLKRLLHDSALSAQDSSRSSGDRWFIAFDTEACRLSVLHEWESVSEAGDDAPRLETVALDVNSYLLRRGDAGQAELVRFLGQLFASPPGSSA